MNCYWLQYQLHSRKQLTNIVLKLLSFYLPLLERTKWGPSRASGGWGGRVKGDLSDQSWFPDKRESRKEFTTRQRGFSELTMTSRHFRTGSLLSRLVSTLPQAVSSRLVDHYLRFHLFLRCSSPPRLCTLYPRSSLQRTRQAHSLVTVLRIVSVGVSSYTRLTVDIL